MSEENVDVIRELLEAWNAGRMDRVRELYDVDVIVRSPPNWPEPGPFIGRDAVMEQFSRLREAFDADSFSILSDYLSTGDRVIVRVDWSAIGHGPEASIGLTLLYTVRNQRVFGLEFFWSHDDALEAAGLSE